MTSIVGGALLAASLDALLEIIVSGEFVDFFQSTKLDVVLLDKLKITLVSLKAVLNDAAEKQVTNPAVKEWLNMLLDGVFEADALFDEINTEALRCKVEANQVLKKLSSRFKRFNKNINSKLQSLFEKLENLKNQNLGLKSGVSNNFWNVTPTSSVVGDESSISEGLVPQEKCEKSWEEVAEQYFDELVSRSLIRQRSIDGKEVSFEMHDLINELAMIVSSPYCIRIEKANENHSPFYLQKVDFMMVEILREQIANKVRDKTITIV
ncbi:hypothetical protein P8452_24514 [Trifolium repens]|nr:hypothetical protein P8452_24514 [Trifolium repens]